MAWIYVLACSSFLAYVSAGLTLFDSIERPEGEWTIETALPDPGRQLKLTIALTQQNIDAFENRLLDMSDPDHPSYGQHMTADEVSNLLQPSEGTSSAVKQWLQSYGIQLKAFNEFLSLTTNVSTANRLLDATFKGFKNKQTGVTHIRTLNYSVPNNIAPLIDMIQPTTRFGDPHSMRASTSTNKNQVIKQMNLQASKAINSTCKTVITPTCLLDLYNVHFGADPNNGNTLGFASFLEQYTRYTDLALFEHQLAPYASSRNISVVSLHGGLNNQTDTVDDSSEANLDAQYAVSIGHPVPVTEFSTAGRGPLVPDLDQPTQASNENEPYLDYLQALLKLPNNQIPQVISHSYGENEQSVPTSYNKKVCNIFMQLGARGKSIIFSSGDVGVGDACISNDGLNKSSYQPQFPAACPWVTSVGSTYSIPEKAAAFSSGGFSRIYPQPRWQQRAVSSYLHKLGSDTQFRNYYNRKGRAFPDVSAQGVNFAIYNQGFRTFASGTSASAPVFASLIALLNSARISCGKPPLGFLNPWLYRIAEDGVFNDITTGGSIGCNNLQVPSSVDPGRSSRIPGAGFNATVGWDPVTGLGSPDFGKMLMASSLE